MENTGSSTFAENPSGFLSLLELPFLAGLHPVARTFKANFREKSPFTLANLVEAGHPSLRGLNATVLLGEDCAVAVEAMLYAGGKDPCSTAELAACCKAREKAIIDMCRLFEVLLHAS